jgi:hypothetical protein
MDNLARRLPQGEVLEQTGVVVRRADAELRVRTDDGDFSAKRAVSCLVQPELGDRVLVACLPSGVCYVLAVLERDRGAATTVAVEGDLHVQIASGRFSVAAQHGVSLVSAKDMALVSAELDVHAVDGNVSLDRLTYLGRLVRAEVEKVKLLGVSLESVLDRLSQRVKRAYRRVEELDQLRARNVDYEAEQAMSLHARTALVTAETLVKVDGEQIHLG